MRKPDKPTQKERIRKYLDDFGSITKLEAIRDIGVMNLGARILEMRKNGEPIICEMERGKNRYDQPMVYARYRRAT